MGKKLGRLSILFACIAGLSATACSRLLDKFNQANKPGYTTVFINRSSNSYSTKDVLLGGIKVYAMTGAQDFATGITIPSESAGGIISLPNGSYTFYGIGWDASDLTGNTYCGLGTGPSGISGAPVQLDGSPVSIDILATQADCNTSDFSDSSYTNGSGYIPLEIVFCGAAANMNSKGPSATCQDEESFAFLAGTGTPEISRVEGRGGYLFFKANSLSGSTRYELYSTNYFTPAVQKYQIKLNKTAASGQGVLDFRPTPDGMNVVFVSDYAGQPELYISPSNHQSPKKLSQGTPSVGGFYGFEITEDGETIVYVSDEDNPGSKAELFAVNIDGSNHRKLYTATNTGVRTMGTPLRPVWDLAPNGNFVVFAADENNSGRYDLFKVNIATSIVTQLSSNTVASGTGVSQARITPDNSMVIYTGSITIATTAKMYSKRTDGTLAENDLLPGLTGSGANYFTMDRDYEDDQGTGNIAFTGKISGQSFYDLFTVVPPYTSSVARTALSSGNPGEGVQYMRFNSDGTKIAYVVKDTPGDSGRSRLYIRGTGGAGAAIQVTDSSAFPGTGVDASNSSPNTDLMFTSNDTKIVYKASMPTSTIELWSNDVTGGTPTNLSNLGAGAGKQVYTIESGGTNNSKVTYIASTVSGGTQDIYYVDSSGTPSAVQLNPTLDASTAVDHQHIIDSDRIFYVAKLNGQSSYDAYIYTLSTSTNSRVSTTKSPSGTPLGRFQISMVDFAANATGGMIHFAPGISSQCLNTTGSDGGYTNLSLTIPTGISGGQRPFAVMIEVFPYATTCTPGTGIMHFFPFGFLREDLTINDQNTKIFKGASSNRLFIVDP